MIKRLLFCLITTFSCHLAIAQSISSNSPLCTDNSPTLELKASGGSTYAWSGPNSFTSNQQNPTISKATSSNSGIYTCVVDGKTSLTTGVKVGKASDVVYAYEYVLGARLIVYAQNNGSSSFTYNWKGPNNFKSTEQYNYISNFDKSYQGNYTVTTKDEFGYTSTASTQVSFSNPDCPYSPVIYKGLKSGGGSSGWNGIGDDNNIQFVKACEGSIMRFYTDTTYWGKNTKLQWFKDNKVVPNANGLEYVTKEEGIYSVAISSGTCIYDTYKVSLKNANVLIPFIASDYDYANKQSINEKVICDNGGQTTLSYNYFESNSYIEGTETRQWYKDGIALNNANSKTLVTTEVGNYQVKVKKGLCEATSSPITVKTSSVIKPNVYFTSNGYLIDGKKTLRLCTDDSKRIYIALAGEGNAKIYRNGTLIGQTNNGYYDYNATQQPGTYTFEVKQGECLGKDSLKLEYAKTEDLLLKKNSYLTCTDPANTYYYLDNSYNNIKWYKNDGLFNSGNYLYPNATAVYQAKYENTSTGCKGESDKISVVIPQKPSRKFYSITSAKKITLCKNTKETRPISVNVFSYGAVWKKDGKIFSAGNEASNSTIYVSEAGRYWYEYTYGQCTSYSDTVEVIEEEIPKTTLTQSCSKDNITKLSVNAISGAKYNWFQNGTLISTNDTTLKTSQNGKYTVEIYRNGCFATSSEFNVGVSIPENFNVCKGDSLKLKVNGDASSTYIWTGPNNFKSNIQNPIVAKTDKSVQGFYKLSTTDKTGCTFTAQTLVAVNDYPAFTLPKTITACAGSDFQFNQLVSKPLTDSTETVSNYYAVAPNKNTYYNNFFLSNVSAKDAGIYNFTVIASQGGCSVKATTEMIIDASNACKSVSIGNNYKEGICAEQTVEIPFKITGNFKTGTIFRAYTEEQYFTPDDRYQSRPRKVILGTGTKSPLKLKGFKSGSYYNIKVESEDGIVSAGSRFLWINSTNYNYIVDASGNGLNSECTALPLKLGYSNTYQNQQWFFNGDTLKKETGRTLTTTKSGKYTFIGMEASGCLASFRKDVIIGKLDKPQISSGKLNELSCFNESVSLNVTQYPNSNYVWKRDGILQTGTDANINATTPGKYTVEVSKEGCNVSSDTIIVKQNTEKNIALNAYTYKGNDKDKMLQNYLTTDYLGNGIYNYQVFKDNQIVAEGRESTILIKDAGKYFFKVSKGDCEAVSNIVDYTLVGDLEKRNLYFNGGYEYNTNTIQLCDSNTVQYIYGYPSYEYQQSTIASRKIIAYRDNKPLPAYNEQGSLVYPSLRKFDNNSTFYLYFKGAGTYYVLEELTLKDSTKLKFRYGDMTVQISSQVNLGSKTPENLFFCGDSTIIYGNTYVSGQRPIAFNWKKDGIIVKKINANESSSLSVKQAGTYVLETVYKGGCVAIATPLKVELQRMNVILTDVPSLEFCEGKPISLNPYIYGLPVLDSAKIDTTKITYQLLKDGKEVNKGNAISSQRGSAYLTLLLKDGGVYKVNTQQGKCQGSSNDLELKAIKVPNSINYADSVLFCQTQSVSLKTNEDATLSYLWERDGGFIKDASKATLEIKEAGIYRSLNRKGACWNYTPKVRAKVLPNILPTAILTGDKEINYADTVRASIAFTSHAPWTFKLSDGKEYTATKSPFEVSLRPQFSTNYTLTEVKNVCGIGTISGTANIKVLVLSSELEEGINLNVFPVPTTEDVTIQVVTDKPEVMEWTLNNTFGNVLMSEVQGSRSIKHESKISLKTVPVGTYFLRIQVGEKSLIRKIIKSN